MRENVPQNRGNSCYSDMFIFIACVVGSVVNVQSVILGAGNIWNGWVRGNFLGKHPQNTCISWI